MVLRRSLARPRPRFEVAVVEWQSRCRTPDRWCPPRSSEAEVRQTWSGPSPAIRDRDIAAEVSALRSDKPEHAQLQLQRRAPTNLRHHLRRDAGRLLVLLLADVAAFGVMRLLFRAVRDYRLLGDALASRVQEALPSGSLNALTGSLSGLQFALALLLSLLVLGNYGPGDRRHDPRRLFGASALAAALPLWASVWTRGLPPVLFQYSTTVVLVWLGLLVERLSIDRIVRTVELSRSDRLDTLFVGSAPDAQLAEASPAFADGGDYRPIGFVDVQTPPAAGALGHVNELPRLLASSGARVVALCGYLRDTEFQRVVDVALAGGCQVLSVLRAVEIVGVHPALVWHRGQPLVELSAPSLKGWQLAVKRVVDVVFSAIGLLLAAPVMLGIAIAIKLDSPGSVLFAHERVGLGGRRFRMLKFRTMQEGADAQKEALAHLNQTGDPRLFKIAADPRVTKLGGWLRRWSLDELPQLWNALVGQMSLVGPRPFPDSDFQGYEDHHFSRLGARPGITGLWQVKGRSDILDFEEVVRLDTQYIREWSLLLDLAILWRTVPTVLGRQGAQ